MRWLADECVDSAVVARPREAGYDTAYMAEIASGTADEEVLRRARDEARLLLTEDEDFGEIVVRSKRIVTGLVLLRIDPRERLLKWTRLESAIARFGDNLFGRYLVIQESRFRLRPILKPFNE